jgi:hypothetical protein
LAATCGGGLLAAARGGPALALDIARLLCAGTYALAALHKLNDAFFNPAISCATHAWAQVIARWPPIGPLLAPLEGATPYLAVGTEVALAWAVWRGSRWVWVLGPLFHVPLTVTLAPAFGAVMASGYFASAPLPTADRTAVSRALVGAGVGAAAALALQGGLGHWPHVGKVAVAAGLATLASAPTGRRRTTTRVGRWVMALWLAHGLTPYLGLQYQHTGAMLSGLRIDHGCHNAWVFPEALRLRDPYVRVDAARIGDGATNVSRERVLTDTLWNVGALHAMHRNWCIPEHRPLTLEGTWRGRPFRIEDLCDPRWPDALGVGWWTAGFQAFQKNLLRRCHAPCVH